MPLQLGKQTGMLVAPSCNCSVPQFPHQRDGGKSSGLTGELPKIA